jgi:hypothetical protein
MQMEYASLSRQLEKKRPEHIDGQSNSLSCSLWKGYAIQPKIGETKEIDFYQLQFLP